jgi:hypothetical protein
MSKKSGERRAKSIQREKIAAERDHRSTIRKQKQADQIELDERIRKALKSKSKKK